MRRRFLTSCLLLATTAGCAEHLCQEGADTHASYRADVLDIYGPGSNYLVVAGGGSIPAGGSCQGRDGIEAGVSLSFQANGDVNPGVKTCLVTTADLTSAPDAVGVGMPSADSGAVHAAQSSNTFMYAIEAVTIGACSGPMVFEFYSQGGRGGIFAAPTPGDLPPTLLYRLFLPNETTCSSCADNFVVQLSKL